MAKVYRSTENRFLFECPACGCLHFFESPTWQFDGDLDAPTVAPSIRVQGGENGGYCHFFIRRGMIEFCADSRHELAGKTVPMPDWE